MGQGGAGGTGIAHTKHAMLMALPASKCLSHCTLRYSSLLGAAGIRFVHPCILHGFLCLRTRDGASGDGAHGCTWRCRFGEHWCMAWWELSVDRTAGCNIGDGLGARRLRRLTAIHGEAAVDRESCCFRHARNRRAAFWMSVMAEVEDRNCFAASRASMPRATDWILSVLRACALSMRTFRRRLWLRLSSAHCCCATVICDHSG